jgi:hypothetical protein
MAVVSTATASVQTNAKTHSRSIVVESPSNLPEAAQRNSEAMYLLRSASGQAILYLEQDQGRTLAMLDVSDPDAIRASGQVSIAAPSPYDFVETLKDSAVLIHYRDNSGFATVHFKKVKQPVLTDAPEFQQLAHAKALGHDGLVLAPTAPSAAQLQFRNTKFSIFPILPSPQRWPRWKECDSAWREQRQAHFFSSAMPG